MIAMKFGQIAHGAHIHFKLRLKHAELNFIKAHNMMKKFENDYNVFFFKSGKGVICGVVHSHSDFFYYLDKVRSLAKAEELTKKAEQLRLGA